MYHIIKIAESLEKSGLSIDSTTGAGNNGCCFQQIMC